MSIATAPAPAGRATPRRAIRPRLRLMAPPLRTQWRPSFPALCVAIIGGCLALLLGINIVLARGAYTEQQLTARQTALMETQQALAEKVARDNAPDVLAKRARDLGMIPNSSPAFLRMSDGKILGAPMPATLAKTPAHSDLAATPLTPEQQAAAAAAANGGAGAIGANPNAQAQSDVPLTGSTSTPSPGATAPSGQQTSSDGATPVGGTASSTGTGQSSTPQPSAAGQGQSAQTSGDGAAPVGGNR